MRHFAKTSQNLSGRDQLVIDHPLYISRLIPVHGVIIDIKAVVTLVPVLRLAHYILAVFCSYLA